MENENIIKYENWEKSAWGVTLWINTKNFTHKLFINIYISNYIKRN